MNLRNLFKTLIGLVILFCTCLAFGQRQRSAPLHVVFDLDWTLLNTTTEVMAKADPEGVIEFEGKLYRIPKGAIESLAKLHQAGLQISIFSGGEISRNGFAANLLKNKVNEYLRSQSLPAFFGFEKVLSLPDLFVVSVDPKDRFPERYKKELSRFFDITHTLLVDDIKEFVMRGQELNMVWLGPTYNDRPRYDLDQLEEAANKKYSAPTYEEWLRDQQKIIIATDHILKAAELKKKNKISFPEAYYQVDPYKLKFPLCRNLFL